MRSFRFNPMSIITVVAVVASCFAWSVSTARAGEDDLKAVHPNVISRTINQPCPRGFDKQFKALLVVPKGSRIYKALELKILFSGGDAPEESGQKINSRTYEYFVTAPSRKTTIDLYRLRYIAIYADYSGHTYKFKLSHTCMSREV